jgi:glycosyltransferase involved in cell wall biosynthesis
LTVYTPYLLPEKQGWGRWTRAVNAERLRRELRRLTRGYERVVCLYDSFKQLPLVGSLGEAVSAYYLYDDFAVDLTGREHGGHDAEAERRMLAAVDRVFPVSERLCEYARQHNAHVHYLPNAFNGDLFRPSGDTPANDPAFTPDNLSAHLSRARRPVIGSAGVISGRVDLVGLLKTAEERPEWDFRLLGQISRSLSRELEQTGRSPDLLERLLALPNVEHLPARPIREVPAVVAGFDVGLVPYCLNRFTLASSPLKVYEYYAMGVPVVATQIPEVVRFDPGIETVTEGQSYAAAIERALVSSTDAAARAARMLRVREHSTLSRAEDALRALAPAAEPQMDCVSFLS